MTALESGADRDSRDRILDAARMRFAQDGFAGASVREIAADAGVAKPMVFYYFGNKDELFRAVVDTSVAELNSRYRASLDGAPTARAALNAFAHAHLDVAEGLSEHVQFLARCVLTVGSEFGEAMRRDHLEVIDELLDRMAADGVTLDDREAARQLIRGVLCTYYMDVVSCAALNSTSPDTFADMIWRALAAPELPL